MTDLRQGLWPQSASRFCAAPTFAAAVAFGLGLLVPGHAYAAPPSHTRRPLPTALHSTQPMETGSHTAARHGKTAGKAHSSAHPAGASTTDAGAARHGKSRGKGHDRHSEPEEPLVPMYRAGRGRAPVGGELNRNLERPRQEVQRHTRGSAPAYAFARGPAPLASGARHGSHSVVVEPASRAAAHQKTAPGNPVARSVPAPQPWVMRHDPRPPAGPAMAPKVAPTTAQRPDAYAEGVSHPDEDVQVFRNQAGAEPVSRTAAPVVRMSPAPVGTPVVPAPSMTSPVVQGFGSEVALPGGGSSNGNDRPGGTRRRNHPATWQPESLVTQPEPLEEREAVTALAVSPSVLPEIYDRDGRLVMPAPLKGSHDILLHQNVMATTDGLERVYDDADLQRLTAMHRLISFPPMDGLRVSEDLPMNRRVARPWTVAFTVDAARAFHDRFHQPLQVNSAVRTVRYQAHLIMVNGNAAGLSGDSASPHLTGQAVDLAKRGMTQAQLAWMRGYLLPLMQAGKIDVEEEFQQACFHISVYRSYAGDRRTEREVATAGGAAVQGAAARGVVSKTTVFPANTPD